MTAETVDAGGTADTVQRMDRMYGPQRHIYDLTRKYYLLGRDRLIAEMALQPGQRLLEVGCGTGRNLVLLARAYPRAELAGIDASTAMLDTARARLGGRVMLAHALAEDFDAGERPYDAIVFSYALSMIPSWRQAIDRALTNLSPGGQIHVVDFYDQADLPAWFRRALGGWLALFGVHYRPAVLDHFAAHAAAGRGRVEITPVARRYAYRLSFTT